MINKLFQSDVETIQYFLTDVNGLEHAITTARRAVEDANQDAELACEIAEATSSDDYLNWKQAEAKDTIAEYLSDAVEAIETSIENVEIAEATLQLILKIIQETKNHENIYL